MDKNERKKAKAFRKLRQNKRSQQYVPGDTTEDEDTHFEYNEKDDWEGERRPKNKGRR
jgi:hypothetical protein